MLWLVLFRTSRRDARHVSGVRRTYETLNSTDPLDRSSSHSGLFNPVGLLQGLFTDAVTMSLRNWRTNDQRSISTILEYIPNTATHNSNLSCLLRSLQSLPRQRCLQRVQRKPRLPTLLGKWSCGSCREEVRTLQRWRIVPHLQW